MLTGVRSRVWIHSLSRGYFLHAHKSSPHLQMFNSLTVLLSFIASFQFFEDIKVVLALLRAFRSLHRTGSRLWVREGWSSNRISRASVHRWSMNPMKLRVWTPADIPYKWTINQQFTTVQADYFHWIVGFLKSHNAYNTRRTTEELVASPFPQAKKLMQLIQPKTLLTISSNHRFIWAFFAKLGCCSLERIQV